jgi:hypothetical protein
MTSAVCARPGCQGPAAAWLTYDYDARRVWLDDGASDGGDRWALCGAHAARLRAPQGWSQIDRRVGASLAGSGGHQPSLAGSGGHQPSLAGSAGPHRPFEPPATLVS